MTTTNEPQGRRKPEQITRPGKSGPIPKPIKERIYTALRNYKGRDGRPGVKRLCRECERAKSRNWQRKHRKV